MRRAAVRRRSRCWFRTGDPDRVFVFVRAAHARCARDLGFLVLPLVGVGEEVHGVLGAHDPLAGQSQRHAGGVDGDPPSAPLFGDVCRGAASAGRVQDEVAGVGAHEHAPLDCARCRLHHVYLGVRSALYSADIGPVVGHWECREIIEVPNVGHRSSSRPNSSRCDESVHTNAVRLPAASGRATRPATHSDWEDCRLTGAGCLRGEVVVAQKARWLVVWRGRCGNVGAILQFRGGVLAGAGASLQSLAIQLPILRDL